MDFKRAATLGSYMSKDYAEDLFRLLVTYQDISASEAASRLNLHIKTVQDFLEAMASLDILSKTEVF
jgi:transposase